MTVEFGALVLWLAFSQYFDSQVPDPLLQATDQELLRLRTQAAPSESANVSGTIRLGHRPPQRRVVGVEAEPAAALHWPDGQPSDELVVGKEGALRWALVRVIRGLEGWTFPTPSGPVFVEFERFRIEPHVLGVQAGRPIRFRWRERDNHVTSLSTEISLMALPGEYAWLSDGEGGIAVTRKFGQLESGIRFQCHTHPWETAWIHVMAHSFFAVTDEDGRYEIRGLPPGRYTIEVWQEKCRTETREIEVRAGKRRTLDVDLRTIEPPPPFNWLPVAAGGVAGAALLLVLILLHPRK